jgi:secreted trypsin-like serine protease
VKRIALVIVASLLLVGGDAAALAKAPAAGKSVIGGSRMNVAQLPFIASVTTRRSLCTGSVISPVRVLTAAHCVDVAPNMKVRTGSSSSFFGGQEVGVAEVRVHPGFRINRNGSATNDVAVLLLSQPVGAPPAELADPSSDFGMTVAGAPSLAAGFGQSQLDLRKRAKVGTLRAALQFSRPKRCRRYKLSLDTTLCTIGERFGSVKTGSKRRTTRRTACSGDSGGPLIGYSPSGPRLVGVASAVGGKSPRGFSWVNCGLESHATAYMRVSAYLSFIAGA